MAEPLKVLIVDDEPAYCVAMSDVLECAGADVRVANAAEEAETLFHQVRPDIVILDLLMRGGPSTELIRRLRVTEGQKRVPIIVASGMAGVQDRNAALDAGANAFILKPFMPKELRDAVRRLIPLPETGALRPVE